MFFARSIVARWRRKRARQLIPTSDAQDSCTQRDLRDANQDQQHSGDVESPAEGLVAPLMTARDASGEQMGRWYQSLLDWVIDPFADPDEEETQAAYEYRPFEEFLDRKTEGCNCEHCAEQRKRMPPVLYLKP